MKRPLEALLAAAVVLACGPARADEQEAKAVIDKAIKAMGGEEKLAKIKAYSSKATGTVTFNGNEIPFTGETTLQGIERFRSEFEGEADGNKFKGVTVVNGNKGWRKFGDEAMEIDSDALANEKRIIYLQAVSILVLPLKGKDFKVDSAPDGKVGDKPASAVKAIGPDGKDFTLYFDKESGLPVKMSAKVNDWQGQEYTQETMFEEYKEIEGIKKATKSTSKRDGERFVDSKVTEFKVIENPGPDVFAEPK